MINFRTYTDVAQPITGYELDDRFSVVVPVARTNEILNPSFETNLTGYTAGAGTLARTTAQQYHGAYSAIYTPSAATTDSFFYGTITTTAGQTRALSTKFLGLAAGLAYKFIIATTAGVELASRTFIATGRWQWIVFYYTETTSTTRRLYWAKAGHASIAPFYVDGVQSEVINAGETVSTYLDGAQLGLVPNQFPAAFVWNGTPHASSSSRSGLTRAGGMVMPFKYFNFLMTAIIGLGLAVPQNVATEYARIDGGYDDYTRKPTRQFTLQGTFQAETYQQLRANRGGLARLLDRDLVGQDQRLVLLRDLIDPCSGDIVATTCRVLGKYQGGLDGSTDNHHAQTTPITFTQYLPGIQADGESGAALTVQTAIGSNANGVLQRSPAGVWSSVGNFTLGFSVQSIVRGLDGLIYMGGDFTPNPQSKIVVLNPVTGALSALGTGAAGGDVFNLAVMPNGDIIASGTFTSMGGVANTNHIARWSVASQAWQSISSGFTGSEIRTMTVSPAGLLYVGGVFTVIGGTAAVNVASYNGTSWSAVGGGIAAGGVSALLAVGSNVYAAVENTNVQKLTSGVWANIGTVTGGGADPQGLAVDARGFIYVGGDFTTIGGITANNIAVYNGVAWQSLGTGLTGGSINRGGMSFDARGLLIVGGSFTSAGGIATPTGSALWNGAAWVYPDVIPGGSPNMFGALALPNGQLYQGTTNNGTATATGITSVTNIGTADAYPTITINGPSSGTARIYSIVNYTTNRAIYLNLTLNAGETATMVFQPDGLSFTSTFQGNIASAILPGSNTAEFFLSPGVNSIAFFSASSTVVATLNYRPVYLSLDDVP